MNNEPVAWMMENSQNTSAYLTFEKPTREMKISHQAIPLYTHPAKTLTDEEILELWDWDSGEILATDLLDFADAILRKAQQK